MSLGVLAFVMLLFNPHILAILDQPFIPAEADTGTPSTQISINSQNYVLDPPRLNPNGDYVYTLKDVGSPSTALISGTITVNPDPIMIIDLQISSFSDSILTINSDCGLGCLANFADAPMVATSSLTYNVVDVTGRGVNITAGTNGDGSNLLDVSGFNGSSSSYVNIGVNNGPAFIKPASAPFTQYVAGPFFAGPVVFNTGGPWGQMKSVFSAHLQGNFESVISGFATMQNLTSADTIPPIVNVKPDRPFDSNGYYNHPLVLTATGNDSLTGDSEPVTCQNPDSYSGPDVTAAHPDLTCKDSVGNVGHGTFLINYDSTAPTVTLTHNRAPDSNGYYNHAIDYTVSGSDGTSGIASCNSPVTYSGPDSNSGTAVGHCTDIAGNLGNGTSVLKFDSTKPSVSITSPTTAYIAGTSLTVTGTASDSTSGIASVMVSIDGQAAVATAGLASWTITYNSLTPNVSHTILVTATDVAGNMQTASIAVTPDNSPPDTKITGAFNSKGQVLKNGSSTADKGAKFFFQGLDNNAISKFQCSLDGAAFTDCSSPVGFSNLQASIIHTFRVRAIDLAGNVDPSPAVWMWKVQPQKLK